MSTVIVAIDPSSAKLSAVVATPGEEPEASLHRTKLPREKVDACSKAYQWIQGLVADYPLDDVYVFLEAPVMGRGGPGSTIPQAQIGGAIMAGAEMSGARVTLVNNAHCKKVVIGTGKASKEDIAAWCKEAWPALFEKIDGDQDLTDAAMIYVYGRKTLRLRRRILKRRRK